ncbi:anaerobic cobalt chelatase [Desulfobulbus propionicus DSM 2032]|uniref:Anaerobic cobalt chelatase n=1 Tax=Desulfobulbus propionicus (strain ATCC 33891 / DSM 2032 / VKM B-1956 / 1pr3) TaxID=577650 RepID=A0A7U4DQI4_DESPD|nr:sirohydrochlorin cobaltochelatase [Desulfobulbus propionicus]ADW19162.1 anaerobic cobalt chelatase [Desulfobulbus propionicus DSM 2032]
MQQSEAIVLAMFGTTVEPALQGLLAIKTAMEAAYPRTPVRLAFTSNQIRRIWHQRAANPAYRVEHPEIPLEILEVQGILATIANLQDRGHTALVVQSTHIAPAEEFHDLASYVHGLRSIRTMKPRWQPFTAIGLGRPLLGAYSLKHAYADDIRIAARALASDAELARSHGAALVYMGHGNHYFPSGGLYLEFAARMRELYADVLTLIATVEGFPALDQVVGDLRLHGQRRVLLKPFLLVAGEHATRDLIGPQEDSWRSILVRAGFEVLSALQGLGEQPAVARIFVDHAAQAAAEAGVDLH